MHFCEPRLIHAVISDHAAVLAVEYCYHQSETSATHSECFVGRFICRIKAYTT